MDHLHRASSLEALDHLQVIVGESVPYLPHLSHAPTCEDMLAGRLLQVENA